MNEYISNKYKDVGFDKQQIEMMAENIKDSKEVLKVFEIIKQNTKNPKDQSLSGITKEQIRKSIRVKSRKLNNTKGQFEKAIIDMTRPMCDLIITFLSGATLIYYDEGEEIGKGKFYQLTKRGIYVYAKLNEMGVIGND